MTFDAMVADQFRALRTKPRARVVAPPRLAIHECPRCGRKFETEQGCRMHEARYCTVVVARLTVREAWRAMLDADQALFAARGLAEYEAEEDAARSARRVFVAALGRFSR